MKKWASLIAKKGTFLIAIFRTLLFTIYKALPQFIEASNFKNDVEVKIKEINLSTDFARDWRNRHISHKDYLLATKNDARPLLEASQEKLKKVFAQFEEFINLFQNQYFNTTTYFDGLESHRGALSLLYVLDEGNDAIIEREKRIRSGNYSKSDIKRKDI